MRAEVNMGIRGRMGRSSAARVLEAPVEDPAESPEREQALGRSPTSDALTPLYAAALLKVALELRRSEHRRTLDELLDRVLEGTPIERSAFRAYLQRNFALVKRTA
jgi:hypothetical protein